MEKMNDNQTHSWNSNYYPRTNFTKLKLNKSNKYNEIANFTIIDKQTIRKIKSYKSKIKDQRLLNERINPEMNTN